VALNITGWIYKQEPIMFNRLANKLAALPTWTRPLIHQRTQVKYPSAVCTRLCFVRIF